MKAIHEVVWDAAEAHYLKGGDLVREVVLSPPDFQRFLREVEVQAGKYLPVNWYEKPMVDGIAYRDGKCMPEGVAALIVNRPPPAILVQLPIDKPILPPEPEPDILELLEAL